MKLAIEIAKRIMDKNTFDELQKLNAPYNELFEKDNHTIGIPGIWGVANGSISTIIDNNLTYFNFVP
jgi:hypothetical protein